MGSVPTAQGVFRLQSFFKMLKTLKKVKREYENLEAYENHDEDKDKYENHPGIHIDMKIRRKMMINMKMKTKRR